MGAGYFVTRDTSGDSSNDSRAVVENPTMNFPGGYKAPTDGNSNIANVSDNSVIKDGIQYVTITARGGYSPRQSSAKAGIPTKLVVKTNGTYDCSASLAIHSLNFRKMLPNTGDTIIDAGTPKAGDTLQGVCGMGMYSFSIDFK
jgi:hypothetical protein